jgi:hypothetical protein
MSYFDRVKSVRPVVEVLESEAVQKFNKNHEPAGSSRGGQFAAGGGGGGGATGTMSDFYGTPKKFKFTKGDRVLVDRDGTTVNAVISSHETPRKAFGGQEAREQGYMVDDGSDFVRFVPANKVKSWRAGNKPFRRGAPHA